MSTNIKKRIRVLLPPRVPQSHKGDFGRIFILAGSAGMSEACMLASQAALKSGAGIVTVGVPQSLSPIMAKRLTEAMWKPLDETKVGTISARAFTDIQRILKNQDVLAIGPGLSQNLETQRLIRKAVLSSKIPVVLDADGLNAFQNYASQLQKTRAPLIITPHPGEFRRLFGEPVSIDPSRRLEVARKIARKFKLILVLKGHETIVADLSGKIFVNSTGNPGMATGGSGDVLTGMIAALQGQKLKPFDAACAGVYLHGFAGDLAAKKFGQISMTAGDVIEFIPAAFKKVLGR